MVFGITGVCRREELATISKTKTEIGGKFTIDDELMKIDGKYEVLRPPNVKSVRLFLNFQSGKCTCQ